MASGSDTWLSDVKTTLINLGGIAHYNEIYIEAEKVRRSRGGSWPQSAKAIIRRTLEEQSSDSESFKGEDLFYSVSGIGKGVWGIRAVDKQSYIDRLHKFEVGELYNRSRDIHDRFGGSRQSGISPSKDYPYVFIFSGSTGEKFGYDDGWDENGVFNYTGEGQVGDMQFSKGNKAIRDHINDGRDILLFEHRGKGKSYRFKGQFICIGYHTKVIPDRDGNDRNGIIFQLKNINDEIQNFEITDFEQSVDSLSALRKAAYGAVKTVKETRSKVSKRNYIERNEAIKGYVLARSKGQCECCGEPAPFMRKNNTPYLEPHHIYKLTDKGMDHPRMMAAITPNCHREIHYGINGKEIDDRLARLIAEKEDALEEE